MLTLKQFLPHGATETADENVTEIVKINAKTVVPDLNEGEMIKSHRVEKNRTKNTKPKTNN